jgi:hypothetical protein
MPYGSNLRNWGGSGLGQASTEPNALSKHQGGARHPDQLRRCRDRQARWAWWRCSGRQNTWPAISSTTPFDEARPSSPDNVRGRRCGLCQPRSYLSGPSNVQQLPQRVRPASFMTRISGKCARTVSCAWAGSRRLNSMLMLVIICCGGPIVVVLLGPAHHRPTKPTPSRRAFKNLRKTQRS